MDATSTAAQVAIRRIADRDWPEIHGIEEANFEFPWDAQLWKKERRDTAVHMFVAVLGGRVAGYLVYHVSRRSVSIINLAVHASLHRRGIGRLLVQFAIEKAQELRRQLEAEVSEPNLEAQMFFRAVGFKADCVLPDFYEAVPGVTAYGFTYRQTAFRPTP